MHVIAARCAQTTPIGVCNCSKSGHAAVKACKTLKGIAAACVQARYEDMNKKTTAASNEVVRLTAERNALAHQLNQLKVGP